MDLQRGVRSIRDVCNRRINRVLNEELVDGHGARLAKTVAAALCLAVLLRQDIHIMKYHRVCPDEVDTDCSARGHQADRDRIVGVELVNQLLAIRDRSAAVKSAAVHLQLQTHLLQYVEHVGPLREQNHAVAVLLQRRQQLAEPPELG